MSLLFRAAIATLALGFGLSAASSVGQITSSEPFFLRGKLVQVAGVPSWSALAGDDVVAGNSSLMVTFNDGSQAIISANSKARIEQSAQGQLQFRLLSGEMTVRPTTTSATTAFYNGASSIRVRTAEDVTVKFGSTTTQAVRRVPPPPPPSLPKPTSTR